MNQSTSTNTYFRKGICQLKTFSPDFFPPPEELQIFHSRSKSELRTPSQIIFKTNIHKQGAFRYQKSTKSRSRMSAIQTPAGQLIRGGATRNWSPYKMNENDQTSISSINILNSEICSRTRSPQPAISTKKASIDEGEKAKKVVKKMRKNKRSSSTSVIKIGSLIQEADRELVAVRSIKKIEKFTPRAYELIKSGKEEGLASARKKKVIIQRKSADATRSVTPVALRRESKPLQMKASPTKIESSNKFNTISDNYSTSCSFINKKRHPTKTPFQIYECSKQEINSEAVTPSLKILFRNLHQKSGMHKYKEGSNLPPQFKNLKLRNSVEGQSGHLHQKYSLSNSYSLKQKCLPKFLQFLRKKDKTFHRSFISCAGLQIPIKEGIRDDIRKARYRLKSKEDKREGDTCWNRILISSIIQPAEPKIHYNAHIDGM